MPLPTDQKALYQLLGSPPREITREGQRRLKMPIGLMAVYGVCFTAMGAIFVALGLFNYPHPIRYLRLDQDGRKARARITDAKPVKKDSGEPEWTVRYAFTDEHGATHEGQCKLDEARLHQATQGPGLDVRYDPMMPQVNRLGDDTADFWFFFGFGPLPLLFGLYKLAQWRKGRATRRRVLEEGHGALGIVKKAVRVQYRQDVRLQVTVSYTHPEDATQGWSLTQEAAPGDLSMEPALKPGSPVAVLYDADRPKVAFVASITYLGLEPEDVHAAAPARPLPG